MALLHTQRNLLIVVGVIVLLVIGGIVFDQFFAMEPRDTIDTIQEKKVVEQKEKKSPRRIYHGAFPDFGGTEDVVTFERITAYEELVGKELALVTFSNNWLHGIIFPQEAVDVITAHGSTPLIRIMPRSKFSQTQDPLYNFDLILEGYFDDQLRAWARAAKNTPSDLLIVFAPEMNGDWFWWSGAHTGGGIMDMYGDEAYPDGPEKYRDTYRYIIDLFDQEGVENAQWIFQVNAISSPQDEWNDIVLYYPGDEYIDWLGVSIYGATQSKEKIKSFPSLLKPVYFQFEQLHPTKPILLSEFGITEFSDTNIKTTWLEEAFATILSDEFNRIQAVSYWHETWKINHASVVELRLDSSTSSLETYSRYIQKSLFSSTFLEKK